MQRNPMLFVLFGATGDLARLKLLPALRELWIQGKIGKDFKFLAIGRKDYSVEEYLKFIREVEVHPFRYDISMLNPEYIQVDFDQKGGFDPLIDYLKDNVDYKAEFYMALAADVLDTAIDRFEDKKTFEFLKTQHIPIIVEKPFGDSRKHSIELDKRLRQIFQIEDIYRNDHYLKKDTVQAIVPIRKQDSDMKHFLRKEMLEEIRVVVSEEVDLGTRAGYFHCRGMSVDWFQSHILQMMATLCADLDLEPFSLSKKEFIDSLEVVPESIIRAQYDTYDQLDTGHEDCDTETFLAAQFTSSLPMWEGVIFSIVAGKALAKKEVLIQLNLKESDPAFGDQITLRIDPPGEHPKMDMLSGDEFQETIMDAYEGNQKDFVSQIEVQAQWKITEELMSAMSDTKLEYYPKGKSWEDFCNTKWC